MFLPNAGIARDASAPARLRGDALLGLLDQGLLSLANLGLGLFLIHAASQQAYGLYVVAYASIMLGVGLANALITTQMTVLAPEKKAAEQDRYLYSMLAGQYLVLIPMLLGTGVVLMVLLTGGLIDIEIARLAALVCAALPGVLLLEYFRRFFLLKLRLVAVLLLDLGFVALLFSLVAALQRLLPAHLHLAAIGAHGVAGLLVGLVALHGAGMRGPLRAGAVSAALSEAWRQGKWAIAGVKVTWLQSQSYVYLLGALGGAASVAEVSAARLLMAPLVVFHTGLVRTFIPRVAILRCAAGRGCAERLARKVLISALVVIALYTAVVAQFGVDFGGAIFTDAYRNVGAFVLLWGAIFLLQAVRSNSAMLLQVLKQFRLITLANALTAAMVVVASVVLIDVYGGLGSLVAMAGGELILAGLLWRALRDVRATAY